MARTAIEQDQIKNTFTRTVILAAGVAICVVALAVVLLIRHERKAVLDGALKQSENLARILAADGQQVVTTIDRILATTVQEAAAIGGNRDIAVYGRIQNRLGTQASPLIQHSRLMLLDADGILQADSKSTSTGADLSGMAFFSHHRQNPGTGLFIGTPVADPATGETIVPLSRSLRGPDGQIQLVAAAFIGANYFTSFVNSLGLPEKSVAVFAHTDGVLVARVPDNGLNGQSITDRPIFAAEVQGQPFGAALVEAHDGTGLHTMGFARLDPAPLLVAVGLDLNLTLARYYGAAATLTAFGVLLAVAIAGIAFVVHRAYLNMAESARKAAAAEQSARRHAIDQQAITAISQFASEVEDTEEFLHTVVRTLRDTLTTDAAFALRQVSDSEDFLLVNAVGLGHEPVGSHVEHAAPGSTISRVLHRDAILNIHDCLAPDTPEMLDLIPPEKARSLIMGSAQLGDGTTHLIIGAIAKDPGAFGPSHAYFLEAICQQISAYFLRQADKSLRDAVFDAVAGRLVVLDHRGVIRLANEAWRSFDPAALPRGRPIGLGEKFVETCRATCGGDKDMLRLCQGVDDVLSGRSRMYSQQYMLEFDGQQSWHRAVVSPFDLQGTGGAIMMHMDVTDQHLVEEQLREALRVDAIGKLTGGMAHDFNNLLMVMLGNAEILVDRGMPDADSEKAVKRIMKAAERGADLTNKLLAYARRQRLDPTELNPAQVLYGLKDLLSRTLRENIRLKIDCDPAGPLVRADNSQLETALVNLVFNSRDALPDGGVIRVSASPTPIRHRCKGEDEVKRMVCFTVEDDGEGIPPEILDRVFEPFFTTKPVGSGTGLGLSMVYGFASQSGGCVEVDSIPGKGTAVHVYLPALEDPALIEETETPAELNAPESTHERIALVVEDEPLVRSFLINRLKAMSFEVIEAETAEFAMEILEETDQIDLILSDVVLTGPMNGFALIEQATRLRPDTPVILMSGYTDLGGSEPVAGFDPDIPLLRKPFKKSELIEAIEKVMTSEDVI